ncbi:MAG: hypothetical protein MR881_07995 [Bacteroidales bacterium]|nr:hypothetical protein [Bacteroidales bacterium]
MKQFRLFYFSTMKKLFTCILLLCSCSILNAQITKQSAKDEKDSLKTVMKMSANAKSSGDSEKDPLSGVSGGGVEFGYMGIEKGFGIDFKIAIKYFYLGFSYAGLETNESITENSQWRVGGGALYRQYIVGGLFVQGNLGIYYQRSESKYKAGVEETHKTILGKDVTSYKDVWKETKDGCAALAIRPMAGYAFVTKNKETKVTIFGGYEWSFAKFKFDKAHKGDWWTVGFSVEF